jgi:tRNA G18 (ribose-2'-O)-methylase SpoU
MPESPLPLTLALNNIRSLLNVGALFRVSAGAGVEKIILGGFSPVPPRHEISKTALGGVEAVPWEHQFDLRQTIGDYRTKGYTIAALEQTERSTSIYDTPISFPLFLILGHEREGVESELLALCDLHLELPMARPEVHSLNVSTAGAIALYELGRRFCYDKNTKL